MNYSIPVNNLFTTISDKEINEKKETLESILTQQIIISQLSNGITFADTENMDEFERAFIFKKLLAMRKDEIEAKQEAMRNIGK